MASAKGYCEDLTEGKFSFPIIHAIRQSQCENNTLLNILKKHTEDVAEKALAVNYMREVTKSFDYTRAVLSQLYTQANALMAEVSPSNPALQRILDKLIED